MISSSKQHLHTANEKYFEHQRFALRYALGCFHAGFMAMVHGFIPGVYCTSASDKVKELANKSRKIDQE